MEKKGEIERESGGGGKKGRADNKFNFYNIVLVSYNIHRKREICIEREINR